MSKRKGFTLIEITLFLAVTAALFIGIALGMQSAINRQRYEDAVQNFAEFMRGIYSQVTNPQSAGSGNSTEYAIYGKLIVFGENTDILGNAVDSSENPVFIYDVVGKPATTQDLGSGDVSDLLFRLNANVARKVSDKVAQLAYPEKYEPRWQTDILTTDGNKRWTGSILVVRHPRSGTVNTLYSSQVIQVNSAVKAANAENNSNKITCLLKSYLKTTVKKADDSCVGTSNLFAPAQIDFCVSPYKLGTKGQIPNQDIRLLSNARNASAVEKIATDGGDSKCK